MSSLNDATANLLNALASNVETTKEIYTDSIKPAIQQVGKIISFPLELVNAMLVKPRCWIANAEYKLKETDILIAEKLAKLDKEMTITLTPPEHYVAVPALQAISYSMDNKELRELYANLLAKSMCKELKNTVHPAYVEIIKQLDPIDVKIFNFIATAECVAAKKVYIDNVKENTKLYLLPIVTSIDFFNIAEVSSSLNNLQRCGLIDKITDKSIFKDQQLYNDVDNNPFVKEWIAELSLEFKNDYEKVCTEDSGFVMTTLGVDFYNICCKDEDFN